MTAKCIVIDQPKITGNVIQIILQSEQGKTKFLIFGLEIQSFDAGTVFFGIDTVISKCQRLFINLKIHKTEQNALKYLIDAFLSF